MKKQTNLLTALLLFAALTLSSCNTIQGVGKDLESAGNKAEEITKKS